MSEQSGSERRDLAGLISDMRVDVASIKTRVEVQTGSLARLEAKLDLGVFREEYERRHGELQVELVTMSKELEVLRDDLFRREGSIRVWRLVFAAAIAVLGLAEALLHH